MCLAPVGICICDNAQWLIVVRGSNILCCSMQVTTGVGFVFVAFEDPAAAVKAQRALHGRMFGENKIDASYYNEAQMQQKIFL